ncbi:hypothetical protein ABL78_5623 [Leptomonas seymouri]|uniref:RRM domain-containing protein n=1 Tax=Leptomonas seymouri TaxID=5684 RepID=A0A0N1IJ37_LEPSE|nr:hypothetical protein ABL78_5623 [Leptomonas seymouri]|eukprot:KPI85311.1 hypothetical protein ABL78_5623 [Leptomonas seymouri]
MAAASPPPKACKSILVTGLPTTINDAGARSLFSSYGQVACVKMHYIRGKPNGTAQVWFRSPVTELRSATSVTLMDHTVHVLPLPSPIVKPIMPPAAKAVPTDEITTAQSAQAASSRPPQVDGEGQEEPSPASCTEVAGGAVGGGPSDTPPLLSSNTHAESAVPTTPEMLNEKAKWLYENLPPLPDSLCASSDDVR